MATKVIMPKQGLQMTEGMITQWIVKEGQQVEIEEPLFEMETDKLTIEIASPASGTLLKIIRGEGDTVPVTEIIAIIGKPGEDISDILSEAGITSDSSKIATADRAAVHAGTKDDNEHKNIECINKEQGRIYATPRARTIALDKGIAVEEIIGTGPEGLIIEKDVISFEEKMQAKPMATPLQAKVVKQNEINLLPFTGIRKVISDKMMQSIQGMAQANHRIKVDMSETVRFREKLMEAGIKVSFTDILIKVVSRALIDFPILNSSLIDEGILLKNYVNMGIAVAVENGLLVPVIKDAHLMTLKEISTVVSELVEKAKKGELKPDDYTGGTFTITNLGMFDIDEFTAIINPPESAILAIGKIDRIPVAEGDNILVKPVMSLSLTYDQRIIDGAPAAQFLQRIKQLLQNPYLLI